MHTGAHLPAHLIDLQVHSQFSDGRFQLPVVVKKCIRHGVRVVAFTEHDTLAHAQDVKSEQHRARVRPLLAIELSLMGRNRLPVDVLAYGFDPTHTELRECVASLLSARQERVRKTVKTLRDLGFVITEDDVLEISQHGNAGKKQIALAVVRNHENAELLGSIGVKPRDVRAFHNCMLRHYDLGRVPLQRKTLDEGTHAVHAAGGVCILAHPMRTFGPVCLPLLKRILPGYIERGIDGIEVFYPRHSKPETARLLELANEFNMLITAGSDFHGRPGERVGQWPDYGLLNGSYDVFTPFLKSVGVEPSLLLG